MLSVCLFVCVIVAQHNNFRTSKDMIVKLGGRCIVQKSRSSSNLGVIASWVCTPKTVALGYDVGEISTGCLVSVYCPSFQQGQSDQSDRSLWKCCLLPAVGILPTLDTSSVLCHLWIIKASCSNVSEIITWWEMKSWMPSNQSVTNSPGRHQFTELWTTCVVAHGFGHIKMV